MTLTALLGRPRMKQIDRSVYVRRAVSLAEGAPLLQGKEATRERILDAAVADGSIPPLDTETAAYAWLGLSTRSSPAGSPRAGRTPWRTSSPPCAPAPWAVLALASRPIQSGGGTQGDLWTIPSSPLKLCALGPKRHRSW